MPLKVIKRNRAYGDVYENVATNALQIIGIIEFYTDTQPMKVFHPTSTSDLSVFDYCEEPSFVLEKNGRRILAIIFLPIIMSCL